MSDVTQKRMCISDLACSLSKQNKRMSFLELGKHLNSNGITSDKNKPFSEKNALGIGHLISTTYYYFKDVLGDPEKAKGLFHKLL